MQMAKTTQLNTTTNGAISGATVIVGIKLDLQSREVLTWALINAVVPGDRVVALHVLSRNVAVISLAKDFDAMLAVYQGFCELKQVELKLKICKGSSIRKALVREGKEFGASKLVLGVDVKSSGIGFSGVSIAKYCAKKLPGSCAVLALKNGKIVFQREAAGDDIGKKRLSQGLSKVVVGEDSNELHCKLSGCNGQIGVGSEASDLQEDGTNSFSNLATGVKGGLLLDEVSPAKSCLICSTNTQVAGSNHLKDKDLSDSIEVEKSEVPSSRPEPVQTNWPSLRRLVLSVKKSGSSDKPKSVTMQWPVRTPNRFSLVHPAQKSVKSEGNQIDNLDCDRVSVVQVDTELPQTYSIDNDLELKLPEDLESLREKYSPVCRVFSCNELIEAISNFSPGMLIGTGGSSSVYKGCLPDGKELAVKILKTSEKTIEEFTSEIEILTTLQHKNIITLRGFCIDKIHLMLVYDYLYRGSLEEILHCEKDIKHILSWSERYKVAVGVAEALAYLHGGGSTEPVIHRDVKSSNILISEDLEPQLSDFGLAKWASKSGSQLTPIDVAGTFGYLAPEYFLYGKVNERVDVYAFGVVLLELLSGRKPISAGPNGKESLVMWAKPILLAGGLKQMIDPCLGNDYDRSQVEKMMLSASLCTRRLNQARPQISVVLKLLKGEEDVTEWARLEVNTIRPPDYLGEEVAIPEYDIQSHLSIALLDVEDDSLSNSSTDCTPGSLSTKSSVEDYLQWRSSRSSSFN